MQGLLKQKVHGVDGILCWKSRHFVLDPKYLSLRVADSTSGDGFAAGPLDISKLAASVASSTTGGGSEPAQAGAGLSVTRVSLEGAQRAVPWSGINAFNGCGFDLVWASGRAWSLLCDDPSSRKAWVDALNFSIANGRASRSGDREHLLGSPTNVGNRNVEKNTGDGVRASPSRIRRRPRSPTAPNDNLSTRHRPPDIPRRATIPVTFDTATEGSAVSRRKIPGTETRKGVSSLFDEESSCSSSVETYDGKKVRVFSKHGKHRSGETDSGNVRQSTTDVTDIMLSQKGGLRLDKRSAEIIGLATAYSSEAPATRGTVFSAGRHNKTASFGYDGPENTSDDPRARGEAGEDGIEVSVESSAADYGCAAAGPSLGNCACHGGQRTGTQSKARRRSEELAKASAATWEQFQQLLKRSRESKDRFDRVMDGALGAGAGTASKKTTAMSGTAARIVPGGQARAGGGVDAPITNDLGGGGGVALRGNNARMRGLGELTKAISAAGEWCPTAGLSSGPTTPRSSVLGLSVDRFASGTLPSSVADCSPTNIQSSACGDGDKRGVGGALGVEVDPTVERDYSRLSSAVAVTDVEMSVLTDDDKARPISNREHRPPRMLERPLSSSYSSSPDVDGKGGVRARHADDAVADQTDSVCSSDDSGGRGGTKGARKASSRVDPDGRSGASAGRNGQALAAVREQELETDVRAARSEAAMQGERCRVMEGISGDITSEGERLRRRLATMETAVAEKTTEFEREREVAKRERDRGKSDLDELERVQAERLREVVGAWERKLDEEKREARREREELRAALSTEIAERRRVSDQLETASRVERALRERLEAVSDERDTRTRLAAARSELEAVALERDGLADELDQCIGRLGDQAREVAAALRSRHQREIVEITSRCEVEKEALREAVTLEADERAREDRKAALLALERRLGAEAAEAARREARLQTKQVEEVKAQAEAAAQATRKDIEKLRGLHKKRVSKLEALLKEEGERLAEARREIALCKANLAGDAGEFQRWAEEQRDQSNGLLGELARIQQKVGDAMRLEAEAREREALAMGRLRKVMEEARLERAEALEVRRQLREALAELESNRNAQARRARKDAQLQRAVEIAQQEVAMVEAERVRWQEDKRSMEDALEKLTRLVYGPPRASIKNNNSSSIATSTNIHTSYRKIASSNAWKPPGGRSNLVPRDTSRATDRDRRRSVPEGGGSRDRVSGSKGYEREACSSIGASHANRGAGTSIGRPAWGGSTLNGGGGLLGTRIRRRTG